MYHENNVPKFDGWIPLGRDVPMKEGDVLVYVGLDSYCSERTPQSGYLIGNNKVSTSHYIGRSYVSATTATTKGGCGLNPDFYPYRKGKAQYSPHAIYAEPLPLP